MQRHYDEGTLLHSGPFEHHRGITEIDVADEPAAAAVLDAGPAVVVGVPKPRSGTSPKVKGCAIECHRRKRRRGLAGARPLLNWHYLSGGGKI